MTNPKKRKAATQLTPQNIQTTPIEMADTFKGIFGNINILNGKKSGNNPSLLNYDGINTNKSFMENMIELNEAFMRTIEHIFSKEKNKDFSYLFIQYKESVEQMKYELNVEDTQKDAYKFTSSTAPSIHNNDAVLASEGILLRDIIKNEAKLQAEKQAPHSENRDKCYMMQSTCKKIQKGVMEPQNDLNNKKERNAFLRFDDANFNAIQEPVVKDGTILFKSNIKLRHFIRQKQAYADSGNGKLVVYENGNSRCFTIANSVWNTYLKDVKKEKISPSLTDNGIGVVLLIKESNVMLKVEFENSENASKFYELIK
ncbi:hypothetical protein TCON_1236 [Astathelohania contejeani]|uniref:Uncharacterized protein n=1 Tax=Astathelohania contejeani TaxID=164912 RepID=A0ABQ7HZC5_9MICR|nr:hypothetical protein TCON_1236 [Thelohania contejeani]